MASAYAGFYVDMVDVYLPVVALAPAIEYFQPAAVSPTTASVMYFATFAATLLGRPIGALIFGHFADTRGRRRLALVAIAGFSVCTASIGLLPGYAQWGVAAPALLVALRFINGIFLGGEYTAATPLAFEHCPPAARGLYGGLLLGAYTFAYISISLVVLGMLTIAPAAGASSPYLEWGWRVPFLLGAALGLPLLALRAKIPESEMWRRTPTVRRPLRVLLTGSNSRDLRQVLLVMTGLWFMSTSVVSVMPRLLMTELQLPATAVTWMLLVANAAVGMAFVAVGAGSQVVGRRRVLIGGAGSAGTVGVVLYYVLANGSSGTGATLVLACAVQVVVLGVWGVATTYGNERFPTAVRSSGFGVGYSLAVVPASFYAVYLVGLDAIMPFRHTQLVLLAVGVLLTLAGAARGPETATVDLRTVARGEADKPGGLAGTRRSASS